MVLYGDGLPSDDPLGPIDGLEELLEEAALGIERKALEERMQDFERRRVTSRLRG
jgi:hypothetical protein